MRKRSQRLWLIGVAAVLALGATALAATALRDTMAFAYTPSQVVEKSVVRPGRSVRIGGLVEEGSIRHQGSDLLFRITDGVNATDVSFNGIPPDLFEEGQGVVASGRFDANGLLVADKILARHDENYMPKEAYDALKAAAGSEGVATYDQSHPGGKPNAGSSGDRTGE
jgi:cytochrome c-type biogenesis protein CcmE